MPARLFMKKTTPKAIDGMEDALPQHSRKLPTLLKSSSVRNLRWNSQDCVLHFDHMRAVEVGCEDVRIILMICGSTATLRKHAEHVELLL
jgi:hypothetical protein